MILSLVSMTSWTDDSSAEDAGNFLTTVGMSASPPAVISEQTAHSHVLVLTLAMLHGSINLIVVIIIIITSQNHTLCDCNPTPSQPASILLHHRWGNPTYDAIQHPWQISTRLQQQHCHIKQASSQHLNINNAKVMPSEQSVVTRVTYVSVTHMNSVWNLPWQMTAVQHNNIIHLFSIKYSYHS